MDLTKALWNGVLLLFMPDHCSSPKLVPRVSLWGTSRRGHWEGGWLQSPNAKWFVPVVTHLLCFTYSSDSLQLWIVFVQCYCTSNTMFHNHVSVDFVNYFLRSNFLNLVEH